MGRTAPPFGARRVGEDGRPVGRRVPHRPFVLPYEGLPPRPVGLPRKRLRPDVTGSRPVRRPYGAAAGVLHAVQPQDDVPHPAGAARRAGRRRLPERGLPGPRRISPTLRTRRRIHRGQAGPAEPARPAAHRAGTGMEDPADQADAVSVARRAPRSSGVRMQPVPDMPFPACRFFRPLPGIRAVPRTMPALKGEFMIPSIVQTQPD